MAIRRDYEVKINKINIDPDRFGRIRPVVWIDTVPHPAGGLISSVELPTIEQLYERGYAGGDHVQLKVIGNQVQLNNIIHKADEAYRWYTAEPKHYCHHCQKNLVTRDGSLYCPDPNCPRTTFARLVYASRVLQLPFRDDDIAFLHLAKEAIQDIPSMLFLTKEQLIGPIYHPDEAEMVADALSERVTALLNPDSLDNLLTTKGKVLNALSIPGLFQDGQRKLIHHLSNGYWNWENLPSLLNSAQDLNEFGVGRSDARRIARHAADRVEELDGISRHF